MSQTPGRKPRHALSDTGPSVPARSGPPDPDARGDELSYEGTGRLSVPEQQTTSPGAGSPVTAVPHPAPAGDDLSGDAPTQALPVVPRPRDADAGRGYPTAVTVARLPEPFRPAPVHGLAAAPASSSGFRLPDLPPTVRPMLPAVLGAATALILALGVVAGVNGAPDPVPAPAPPAPVSNP
ncbi:hypothetical protein H7X46_00990 [Pseudonocardia sp. C8]|uniref:hypothetical protein n=1 Tax=Pseudonocardia sp. C8 TaxID=2762759 RepID=UPI001642E1A5|nr:hypothetical protein [Pseudonocardia sp. C8]MBC3189643.1 hypothetical protein [Pseudonocardia sp. C8]